MKNMHTQKAKIVSVSQTRYDDCKSLKWDLGVDNAHVKYATKKKGQKYQNVIYKSTVARSLPTHVCVADSLMTTVSL